MRRKRPSETAVKVPGTNACWASSTRRPASTSAATSTSGFRWRNPPAKDARRERAAPGPGATLPSQSTALTGSERDPHQPQYGAKQGMREERHGFGERRRRHEGVAQGHVEKRCRVADPAQVLLVAGRGRLAGLL